MRPSLRVPVFALGLIVVIAVLLALRTRRGWALSPVEIAEAGCHSGAGAQCGVAGYDWLVGKGVAADAQRAHALFRAGCELDDGYCCAHQGDMERRGAGAPKDEAGAERTLAKACRLGSAYGCSAHGELRLTLAKEPADRLLALDDLKTGCRLGDTEGCVGLGRRLELGDVGIAVDFAAARAAYEAGCAHGSAPACRGLASDVACGRGGPRDLSRAGTLLASACEHDDWPACAEAARMVARGVDPGSFNRPSLRSVWVQAALDVIESRRDDRHQLEIIRAHLRPADDGFLAFLAACDALDQGRADLAPRMEAVRAQGGKQPQVAILEALAARRRDAGGPWMEALVGAWVARGSPDLRGTPWSPSHGSPDYLACHDFGDDDLQAPLDGSLARFLAYLDANKFVLSGREPRELPDEVLTEALRFADSDDLTTQLVALHALDLRQWSTTQRALAAPRAARLRAALAQREPGNLYFGLFPLCGADVKEAPLHAADLAWLEAAPTSRFHPPHAEVFRRVRALLAEEGARGDGSDAFPMLVDLVFDPVGCLLPRADATRAEAPDVELGDRLLELGTRVAEGGWMLEGMVGVGLERDGAQMTQRERDRRRADEDRAAMRNIYAPGGFMPERGEWPLPTMVEEEALRFSDQEVATMRTLEALVPASPAMDGGAP